MATAARLLWVLDQLSTGRRASVGMHTYADKATLKIKLYPEVLDTIQNGFVSSWISMVLSGLDSACAVDHGHCSSSGISHISISLKPIGFEPPAANNKPESVCTDTDVQDVGVGPHLAAVSSQCSAVLADFSSASGSQLVEMDDAMSEHRNSLDNDKAKLEDLKTEVAALIRAGARREDVADVTSTLNALKGLVEEKTRALDAIARQQDAARELRENVTMMYEEIFTLCSGQDAQTLPRLSHLLSADFPVADESTCAVIAAQGFQRLRPFAKYIPPSRQARPSTKRKRPKANTAKKQQRR